MSELVDPIFDSQYAADVDPKSTAPISIARFGSFVRTTATSSNPEGGASWISDLTNDTINPPYSFAGVISEVIVFNRKLSELERQQVYGYLAQKYRLDSVLSDDLKYAHHGVYGSGATYWQIEPHPNTKGLTGIPQNTSISDIILEEFFSLPEQVYKSSGTKLPDGTVLGSDTYNNY